MFRNMSAPLAMLIDSDTLKSAWNIILFWF